MNPKVLVMGHPLVQLKNRPKRSRGKLNGGRHPSQEAGGIGGSVVYIKVMSPCSQSFIHPIPVLQDLVVFGTGVFLDLESRAGCRFLCYPWGLSQG